jgi:hypothetical protein
VVVGSPQHADNYFMRAGKARDLARHLLAKRIAVHRAPRKPPGKGLWAALGPGLITGASDDDPSGIATYSQAGAQFGFSMAGSCCSPFR